MDNVLRVTTARELTEQVEQGYIFSSSMIQEFFRLSRTQYYDYVSNYVTRVKIPKRVREEVIKECTPKDFRYKDLMNIALTGQSVLLSYHEVFRFLLDEGLLSFEQWRKEEQGYARYDNDEVLRNIETMTLILIKSEKRDVLETSLLMSYESFETSGKALESKFFRYINNKLHFRVIVCGIYLYVLETTLSSSTRSDYDLVKKLLI